MTIASRRVVDPLVLVVAGECAAANDGDLHRLEIAVARMVEERRRRLGPGRWRLPFDVHRATAGEITHRRGKGDGRGGDVAPRADAMQQLVEERVRLRFVVADLPGIEADGDQMIGVETEIDVLRRRQRLREERGYGEQRERSGDLPDDQRAAKALPVAALRLRSAAIVKRAAGIGPRRTPGGPQADGNARQHRRRQGVQEDVHVERHLDREGKIRAEIQPIEQRARERDDRRPRRQFHQGRQ